MTWTYDIDQITARDRIRFIIGDTDKDRQTITDEEIAAVLARNNNDIRMAAIEIVDSLEAKFIKRAESRSGDIIADFLTVAGKYRELAKRLRKKGVKGFALIYTSDRLADKANEAISHPPVSLGEFDDPEID